LPIGLYRNTHGILLTYDVTHKSSLDNVDRWLNEIKQYAPHSVTIVLVGTKRENHEKVITIATATEIATKYNLQVFETSAKTGEGIEEVFTFLIKQCLKNLEDESSTSTSNTSGSTTSKTSVTTKNYSNCWLS